MHHDLHNLCNMVCSCLGRFLVVVGLEYVVWSGEACPLKGASGCHRLRCMVSNDETLKVAPNGMSPYSWAVTVEWHLIAETPIVLCPCCIWKDWKDVNMKDTFFPVIFHDCPRCSMIFQAVAHEQIPNSWCLWLTQVRVFWFLVSESMAVLKGLQVAF